MEQIIYNDKVYKLKYNFRALMKLEELNIDLFNNEDFKISDIAKIIYAGLCWDKDVTEDLVLDLLDYYIENDGMQSIMNIISKQLELAFGTVKGNKKK